MSMQARRSQAIAVRTLTQMLIERDGPGIVGQIAVRCAMDAKAPSPTAAQIQALETALGDLVATLPKVEESGDTA